MDSGGWSAPQKPIPGDGQKISLGREMKSFVFKFSDKQSRRGYNTWQEISSFFQSYEASELE